MMQSGNGDPRQCALNLTKMVRGECPYERIKGIDPQITDSSIATAKDGIAAEVEWVIDAFEPRVEVESVEVNDEAMKAGDFSTMTTIKLREEESEVNER